MSRTLRIELPRAVYHVTGRGNARQRIYRNDDDREQFLAVLARVYRVSGEKSSNLLENRQVMVARLYDLRTTSTA